MLGVSDFMMKLAEQLQSQKDITESSANAYIQRLYTLNNKRPFKNLAFLRNKEDVLARLEPYAETTYRNMLGAITSVLSLYQNKPSYKSLYQFYSKLLNDKHDEAREYQSKYSNHKTEKQAKNWITWDEVLERKKELKTRVEYFCNKKSITPEQKDILLQFLILSLYTDIPPRRNQDYQLLYLVKNADDKPTDKNYLAIDNKTLYFNKYKTSKKYGQVKIDITDNEPLRYALRCYLAHHPHNKGKKGKNFITPLLVNPDGTPLSSVNSITRILNKIFHKKVGSSMLRHIYLTSKYGEELQDMKDTATAMGHSITQQREYVKDKPPPTEGGGMKTDPDMEALLQDLSNTREVNGREG